MKDKRGWFRRYRSWRKACKVHDQMSHPTTALWVYHMYRLEQTCPYNPRKMIYAYGGLSRSRGTK